MNCKSSTLQNKSIASQEVVFYKQLPSKVVKKVFDNKLWITSWKNLDHNFNLNGFKKEFQKILDLKWFTYNETDLIISEFAPLMIHSSQSSKFIDLYSHNIVLDTQGDNTYFSSDANTRVFIDDGHHNRTELVTTGSVDIIEDALWINDEIVVLLGYEYLDNMVPFIWVFDIKEKIHVRYLSSQKITSSVNKKNFLTLKNPKFINE
ncbi:hypothetical protein [Tenacibaculum sp. 190524A05c]|uniref:hypothetical protein n=1 Tax=Tenacibaculum platacis TaxID=3137852 RepID=UPI0032B17AB6